VNVPLWVVLPVLALAVIATWIDVKSRRIPNLLTFPALLLGLLVHLAVEGLPGLGRSALGMLVAGGLMMPGWLLKWKGGGDVKLMAAVGAWFGFPLALMAALLSLIAGGVVAFLWAARHRVLRQSLWGASLMGAWLLSGTKRAAPPPVAGSVRFPFGIAVLIGSFAALWIPL
jgi:prepilin peptidase CpaA